MGSVLRGGTLKLIWEGVSGSTEFYAETNTRFYALGVNLSLEFMLGDDGAVRIMAVTQSLLGGSNIRFVFLFNWHFYPCVLMGASIASFPGFYAMLVNIFFAFS